MASREEDDSIMLEASAVVEPNEQSESDEQDEQDEQSDSEIAQKTAPANSKSPTQNPDSYFTGWLDDNQRRKITSEFVGDIHITFDTHDENIRAQSTLLPKRFYRTFYETSATLSSFVTVDTHVKHRERKDLKIDHRNAFQSIGEFSVKQSMFQEAIKRHLVWNQKKIPSTYISVFNCFRYAKRRARFHSETSQRIGQRVSVAKINTNHLIPATIRGLCKSRITIITKNYISGSTRRFMKTEKSKEYTQHVDIPVWIHKEAKERYGSQITPEQWRESGADMWMSITELRLSNLRTVHPTILRKRDTINGEGHDYEWLCCGAIPKSLIMDVWPWDGKRLYIKNPGHPIRSFKNSGQTWVWHWEKKMWLPDTFSAPATVVQAEQPNNKRQRTDDAASQDKDQIAYLEGSKTHQPLSMSIIQSVEIHPGDPTFTHIPKTCPKWNHRIEQTLVLRPPRPIGLNDKYSRPKRKSFRPY